MPKRKPTRRKQLGVTDALYDAILAEQGGVCAISSCQRGPSERRRLDTDHDHKTGRVRGLLCHLHNRLMPAWATATDLRECADYLEANAA